MDCKKAEKLLVEYLYQELSPKYTVDLEKHLQVCDACTQTLENWRAIHRGYQKTTDEAPAVPYLKQRILSAAKEELQRKPSFSERFFLVLKPALILPVILFGLIATLMLYQTHPARMMSQAPAPAPKVAEQPSVSQSSLDLDKTRAYKREGNAESKADSYHNERGKQVDKETSENLKALGYIDSRVEERDRIAGADEKAGAKDVPSKEYQQAAPSSEETLQPQREMALEEQKLKNETGVAGGAIAPSTPSASAPAQRPEAKKMAKAATPETDFEVAQENFARNNLNDGITAANQAIQNDKSQGRADLAVQFHEAGKRYQENKEPEQAIVQYNLVLNNYPSYTGTPDVLLRLAESYEQRGDYDQAVKTYQQLAQYPSMKNTAVRRIGDMQKKQKARDQLRSLGYTDQQKNN